MSRPALLPADTRYHSIGVGNGILPVTGLATTVYGGNLLVQLLGAAVLLIFGGIVAVRLSSRRPRAVLAAGVDPARHRASRRSGRTSR
jgi:hypothetical protein